jgi:glyoxylase-like metal-dependent hydrolase (beta-lactamase superfamily II)
MQLEPLVRRVLAPNPSPYTYTGTQSYIVGIGDGCAVIDPGPNETEHLLALDAAIGEEHVCAIMCTHTHRDHSPAAKTLAARTGAPIVGCAPLVLDDSGPRADASFDRTYEPDRVMEDGEQMTGPGWTLTAVATPGHVSNHLCFALEESGALFTGDHIMGWSTSVVIPPDGDMGDYMKSLERLYGRELVRGMIGHRRQRENQIVRLLGEGPHEAPDFVGKMYKGLDPKLHKAAEMSVTAHLIDLEQRGLVARSGNTWQTI